MSGCKPVQLGDRGDTTPELEPPGKKIPANAGPAQQDVSSRATLRCCGSLGLALTVAYLWLCFIKLPLTTRRDGPEQSWEAVLSYGAAHHLQWGRDVVFTFGPLGFLTSDHYWGTNFWPVLLWALLFGMVLAVVFLRFSRRIAPSILLVLLVVLPLLTTPPCDDLGFDPIYFLALTLLGIACLPDERPSAAELTTTGVLFGVVTLIKFTFAIYSGYALVVVVAASVVAGARRKIWPLVAGWVAALLMAAWWTGQNPASLARFFWRAAMMSAGYSSGMGLPPSNRDLWAGVMLLVGLVVLTVLKWPLGRSHAQRGGRLALLAGGVALTWKEGFVRSDVHVAVFFLYSFIIAALLPALLDPSDAKTESAPASPGSDARPGSWLRPVGSVLNVVVLLVALTPFTLSLKQFSVSAVTSLVPRYSDSLAAIVTPLRFKTRVENLLNMMRLQAALPRIRATTGNSTVGVVGFDQDMAILNGLNYVPHPVFQNYSAYTPALQRLNTAFFNSDAAPDFVLCRLNTTLDGRFPTLDDGEVLLKVLTAYSPVLAEKGVVLWKRTGPHGPTYRFGKGNEREAPLGVWVPISTEPTWLTVQLKRTWLGILRGLLRAGPEILIEVQLADGRTATYRLISGSAEHGFLVSPLLQPPVDGTWELSRLERLRVIKARICTSSPQSFQSPVRLLESPVYGLPQVGANSDGK